MAGAAAAKGDKITCLDFFFGRISMRLLLLFLLISNQAWSKVLVERVPNSGLQPQAAVDDHGVLHMIYMTGDPGASDIWYVRRKPGATAFSKALRVNSQPGSAMAIGTIRGAKMALGENNSVHIVWNGSGKALPKELADKNPFLYSKLDTVTGKFEAQRNLITKAYGLDGGGTVAADGKGNIYVSWASGYQAKDEAHRKIWIAVSHDSGATFAAEHVANQAFGACGCCGMGSSTDAAGNLYILYRPATNNTQRGMHLLTSKDSGLSFTDEKLDDWQLNGCPMSNASFSLASSLLGAWEKDGTVYVRGMDALSQRQAWVPNAQGNSRFPSVAQSQNQVLVAWAEGTGWAKGGAVAWQAFDKNGKNLGSKERIEGLPAWSMPAAVAGPGADFTVIY
jgi:hypothetical protein